MTTETLRTEQENFWAGTFGDEYVERNTGEAWIATNSALFAKILSRTKGVDSIIEFGANIGLNLRALRRLLPGAELATVEINPKAVAILKEWGEAEVCQGSILEFEPTRQYALSFTKGVLIHINPDMLDKVYDRLYRASRRYICVAEYYNPTPVTIPYRGHDDRLFKRDFAGELLERFHDLHLVDYGFVYRRDPNFPQDDLSWFLLEKSC